MLGLSLFNGNKLTDNYWFDANVNVSKLVKGKKYKFHLHWKFVGGTIDKICWKKFTGAMADKFVEFVY